MAPLRESPITLMLRAAYRCDRCHKHCPVPCRFTAAEFRELERRALDDRPVTAPGEATDDLPPGYLEGADRGDPATVVEPDHPEHSERTLLAHSTWIPSHPERADRPS